MTLDCITGAATTGGTGFGLLTFAGVAGSVTSEDMGGTKSASEEMVMTLAAGGMVAWFIRLFLAFIVPVRGAGGLIGETSSPCTGLEALHPVDV
jgi:hypothetical protein